MANKARELGLTFLTSSLLACSGGGVREIPALDWQHANATLWRELPVFSCVPTENNLCSTEAVLPPGLRVRVADITQNNLGYFFKIQFPLHGSISTLWVGANKADSIAKDPEVEPVVPEIQLPENLDQIIEGRWELAYFDLTIGYPHTVGFMQIGSKEGEIYPGKLYTVVTPAKSRYSKKNLWSRTPKQRKFMRSFTILPSERVLVIKNTAAGFLTWSFDQMVLYYHDSCLFGWGIPEVRRDRFEWSDLVPITFCKAST